MDARLLGWTLTLGLGIPLVSIYVTASSEQGLEYGYVMVAMFLLWVATGAASLILCLRFAFRRAWRQSLAAAMLPVVLLFFARDPSPIIEACLYASDVTHFVLIRPSIDARVAAHAQNGRPRLILFRWDRPMSATSFLAYDESDQIFLSRDRQSSAWQARMRATALSCGAFTSHRLWAHYAFVEFRSECYGAGESV